MGTLTEQQIAHMVERFLQWRLPEDFNPDCGISFKRTFNDHMPSPQKYEPVGTNLFDAAQATDMVRYMAVDLPKDMRREELAKFLYQLYFDASENFDPHWDARPAAVRKKYLADADAIISRLSLQAPAEPKADDPCAHLTGIISDEEPEPVETLPTRMRSDSAEIRYCYGCKAWDFGAGEDDGTFKHDNNCTLGKPTAPSHGEAQTEVAGEVTAARTTVASAYLWLSGGYPAQAQDHLLNALDDWGWKHNPKFAWSHHEHQPEDQSQQAQVADEVSRDELLKFIADATYPKDNTPYGYMIRALKRRLLAESNVSQSSSAGDR